MTSRCLIIIVLLSALLAGCNNAPPPVAIGNGPASSNDVNQPNTPSKPIEEMSWTKTDGTEQRIGDLHDRVVILDFWATYCPPCREEIPHLNSLQAKYGSEKLQIVGLNVGGDEDQPKIPAFTKELKVAYPIAYPEQPLVSYIFGNDDVIPQTAVFDRQGRLVLKIAGYSPQIRSELDDAIEKALKE